MKVSYSLSADDHLAWFDHLRTQDKPSAWPSVWSWLQGADPVREREQFIERLRQPGNSAALGPRTLELTEQGVRETGAGFDFITPWPEISRVEATECHLFIAHTSLNAHVVPVRCFTNGDSWAAFVSEVRAKVKQPAQPSQPIPRSQEGWS